MCWTGTLCGPKLSLPLDRQSCTKWAGMFLSFVLYVDNSDSLHVEWQNIECGSLGYTMVGISAHRKKRKKRKKKTGQTIILRELLRQISQDYTKIVQGWLSGQELFQEVLEHSFPTKPLAFDCTSEIKYNKGCKHSRVLRCIALCFTHMEPQEHKKINNKNITRRAETGTRSGRCSKNFLQKIFQPQSRRGFLENFIL